MLNATAEGRFQWRSARGLAGDLGAGPEAVQAALDNLLAQGQVRRFPGTNANAPAVYGAISKVGSE